LYDAFENTACFMYRVEQSLRELLEQHCAQRAFTLIPSQAEALLRYLDLVLYWQKHLNLTGLHDPVRVLEVLILESLDFLQRDLLPTAARVLDLGTGAGVPGIPLAICAADLHLTLLDRSEKKITFVRRVVSALRLPHCTPWCSPAEEAMRWEMAGRPFDVVVSRGVGTIAQLSRLAAPFLHPGGMLVLRKPLETPEIEAAASLLAATGWGEIRLRRLPAASSAWGLVVVPRQEPGFNCRVRKTAH
jgi:16S rRNA (guanine527-N7)-methyltransferase